MANNVTIPATGTGDTTPKVSTDQVSADSSQVQNVQQVSVSGGVITRNPTVPVSAASLPLPTGAATQATLAALLAAFPSALGQKTMANSLAVVVASDQSAVPVSGTVTTTPPSNASTNITQVAGSAISQGHGTAATAIRVELPTDGTGIVGLAAGAATVGTVNLGTISTAATAAKQPAIGTSGTPSVDVLSVQGVAGGTAIPVSGSFSGTSDLTATASLTGTSQAASITTLNGMSVAQVDVSGTFSATLTFEVTVDGTNWIGYPKTILATGQQGVLTGSNTTTGIGNWIMAIAGFAGFRVRCSSFVSGTAVVVIRASAAAGLVALSQSLPGGTNAIGSLSANQTVDVNRIAGTGTAVNNGVVSAGVQRVTIASDSTGQVTLAAGAATIGALTANQSVNQAQVAGTAVDTNSGNKSAGTQRVVIATDQVQLTNALKVDGSGVTQPVSTELATGLTTFSNTALSNTKTAVKAGAGKLYGWMIHNPSAATTFIQVWNVAIGSITVGTTAPTYVIAIPSGASANVFGERGITHSTEINIAATTTATGSSAPATACVVAMFYI